MVAIVAPKHEDARGAAAMTRRIGLIGHGAIGSAVAEAVASGSAGDWRIAAILVRQRVEGRGEIDTDPERFFARPVDLYLETAGPQALAELGAAALARADVWSVSGAALADEALRTRLLAVGIECGHRLRLVSGAVGGLDALRALACDAGAAIELELTAPEDGAAMSGSAREMATRLPNGTNLAVAAAIASIGLDHIWVRIDPDPDRRRHAIRLSARSAYGAFTSTLTPHTDRARGVHVVAASLIGALRQADQVIWAG
jgi:aspartate dehydrogenase